MTLKPEDDKFETEQQDTDMIESSEPSEADGTDDAKVHSSADQPEDSQTEIDMAEEIDSDEISDEVSNESRDEEDHDDSITDNSIANDESDETESTDDDDEDLEVEFDGDRPLVSELQYKVPKGKAAANDEETGDTKFSSVAEARAVVEGFLFSCNEPLTVNKLAKLMGNLHPKTVRGLLLELQWEYENRPGALQVMEIAGGYQLCTRAYIAPWMFRMHKHKRRSALSPATLESLAIIAYRQPITKGEIETIRGVDTGAPIRTLQDLGLVEASGRREVVGRPQLYVTTEQFLKTFGLKSVGDLPSISELKSKFAEEQKMKAAVAETPKVEEEADKSELIEDDDAEREESDLSDEHDQLNEIDESEELDSLDETDDLDELGDLDEDEDDSDDDDADDDKQEVEEDESGLDGDSEDDDLK